MFKLVGRFSIILLRSIIEYCMIVVPYKYLILFIYLFYSVYQEKNTKVLYTIYIMSLALHDLV